MIVAVASYVRLAEIDLSWFASDQARDARKALEIVHGRALPLVGPEVDGGPSHTWGPLYFYLLAVPFALSPDPAVAAAFLSVLNLAAVYVTYRFGTAFFSREVGLIGAALFATYPFAVVSARALWNLAPIPLFTATFFYCLFALVVERRSMMIIPALASLACALQFHLSTVSFIAVFVLAFTIYRPKIDPRHLRVGAAVFVLALLPYLWAATQTPSTELHGTLRRLSLRPPGDVVWLVRQVFFSSADLAVWMVGRFGEHGGAAMWPFASRVQGWLMLIGAGYAAGKIGKAWARGASLRTPEMARYGLLALWIWVPHLMLSLKGGSIAYYYFDVLYPAPFVAGAVLLADLAAYVRSRGRPGCWLAFRVAVLAFVLLTVVSQVGFLRRLWTTTALGGGIPLPTSILHWGLPAGVLPDGRLMPMRYKREIVRTIVAEMGPDRDAFYRRVHGSSFEDLLQDKGFFFDWVSSAFVPAGPPARSAPVHVSVLRAGVEDEREAARIPHRGPFRVVTYVPFIDYSSWMYSHDEEPSQNRAARPERVWTRFTVPTRRIPDAATLPLPPLFGWSRVPVLIRGDLIVPPGTRSLSVAVSLVGREGNEHRVEECHINDVPVRPREICRYHTLGGVNSESVVDLSGALREGRNVLLCRISGHGASFDLDVYELR